LDPSKLSVAQKIAAGNLMGEKLAKITANTPRMRELERLDAQSDFDEASRATAESALARIQAATRR
jgi:hypothetical protein